MTSHADVNALAAFIDGRATDAERAAMVEHFASCEECRARLAAYARGVRPARPAAMVWLPLAATVIIAAGATLLLTRSSPGVDAPAVSAPPAAAPAVPRPSAPVTDPAVPVAPPAPDLSTRRSGERQVGGKTFRLVAGEWIDADYDPLNLLPVEDAVGPELTRAAVARIPALEPYLALQPRVLVVHDKVVYRLGR